MDVIKLLLIIFSIGKSKRGGIKGDGPGPGSYDATIVFILFI
jgi:hypothetical protein